MHAQPEEDETTQARTPHCHTGGPSQGSLKWLFLEFGILKSKNWRQVATSIMKSPQIYSPARHDCTEAFIFSVEKAAMWIESRELIDVYTVKLCMV